MIPARTTPALMLAALLLPPAAAAAELTVRLAPNPATVGDRVEALVELTVAPGELAAEPRFPAWDERWGAAEIVEAGPVRRVPGGGGLRFRQRLVLTAFRTGPVELPPRQVALPGAGSTAEVWTPDDLALEVASVLPAGSEPSALAPRPPAPPAPLPLGRAFWATLTALAVLAAGVLALVLRRRRGGAAAASARSPRDELDAALLASERARTAGEGHVLLSLGLRRFLGRRFGFPAAESTTAEVHLQLRGRRCPPAVESRVHEVLLACDRVKFARAPASRPALEARVEAAREIAAGVEEHLRPRAPEQAADERGGRRREEAA